MTGSVFHRYEKYWRRKRKDVQPDPLDWFDVKCLAVSLLSEEERNEIEHYVIHEEFIEILVEATKTNNFESLLHKIKETKLNLNFFNLDGFTPLQTVSKLGKNELLHILLQYGANPNICDLRHGYSCLQLAAMNNHPQCIQTLLSKNANISYINKASNYRTVLHYAAEGGYFACMKEILFSRELNIVKKREIEKDIKEKLLNKQDIYGLSALHLAVIDGKIECVKLLVEAGAFLSLEDDQGRTALEIAQQINENSEITSYLRSLVKMNVTYSDTSSSSSNSGKLQPKTGKFISGNKASVVNHTVAAVSATTSGVNLFDGCDLVYNAPAISTSTVHNNTSNNNINSNSNSSFADGYRNNSSGSSSSAGGAICNQSEYFIVAHKDYILAEKMTDMLVLCADRSLANELLTLYTDSQYDSVNKQNISGNNMNNNTNIFSHKINNFTGNNSNNSNNSGAGSCGGIGSGNRWGRSPSSDNDNNSSVVVTNHNGSPSNGTRKSVVKAWHDSKFHVSVLHAAMGSASHGINNGFNTSHSNSNNNSMVMLPVSLSIIQNITTNFIVYHTTSDLYNIDVAASVYAQTHPESVNIYANNAAIGVVFSPENTISSSPNSSSAHPKSSFHSEKTSFEESEDPMMAEYIRKTRNQGAQ